MADQTVSLKLDADASDLRSEVQASGQAMEDMADSATGSAREVEEAVSSSSSAWEEHAGVINGVAVAAGAMGAMFEGFARGQSDTNATLARTAIAAGETEDALRDSAVAMSDHTFAASDAIDGMERLTRSNIATREEFETILPVIDTLADATGRDLVASIDTAERMLLPFGQSLHDVEANGDQMVRMLMQTNIPLGTLERNLERVAPELQELGFGLDDAAAGIHVFNERGLQGREAVREFRRAVAASDGDMSAFLERMGLTAAQWEEYHEAAAPVPGLMDDIAEANNDAMTPMERMSARLDNLMTQYGGLADAAGVLSPVMMGAGGLVFGFNQLAEAKARMVTHGSRLVPLMGRAGVAGVFIAAAFAADRLADSIRGVIAPVTEVEDIAHALEGIAATGEIPPSVANSLDGVGDALARLDDPTVFDRINQGIARIPLVGSDPLGQFREEVEAFDAALAQLAVTSDDRALVAGLEHLRQETGLTGDAFDELIRNHFPEYSRALEQAGFDSQSTGADLDDLGDDFDDLSGEIEDTVSAVDDYLDALRRATDPVFNLMSALDAVEDAQQAYNDAVEEHGPKSDEASRAATDLARSVARAEAAAVDGDLSFEEFRRRLDQWVDMGVITAEQAEAIEGRVRDARGEAENYTGEYVAEIIADTDAAVEDIARVVRQLGELPTHRSIQIEASLHGSGAAAVMGEARAFAAGGRYDPSMGAVLVGERGPELVTFGEPANIHDATTTAQMLTPPSVQPRGGDGASAPSAVYNLYGNVDRDTYERTRHHERMRRLAER